ncbi:trypsin-2-like [Anopheles nili]|uniref:trypsin-2-like n=1 Tax=Anopheles nili TaxID=185578 RepID=UPI00237B9B3A|nr:trypsin-2-like [Anopheles nili]
MTFSGLASSVRTALLISAVILCTMRTFCSADEPRIVGGFPATNMALYHQVSVRSKSADLSTFGRGHICGGSLINAGTVLSAAHCMVDVNDRPRAASYFRIVGGNIYRNTQTPQTFVSDVKKVVVHSNYNANGFLNDIGVFILAKEVASNHVSLQPIPLAVQVPPNGTQCLTSGWGSLYYDGPSSDVLMAVNISIIAKATCNAAGSYAGSIVNGMLCAGVMNGGKDACQGDSGGPLVCNGVLVGVVSYGVDCALPQYPGVYADVPYYRDWIVKNNSHVANLPSVVLISFLSFAYFWLSGVRQNAS